MSAPPSLLVHEKPAAPSAAPRAASWASLAGGAGALLVPKCPACFAAYGSALGALGFGPAFHERFVGPALAVLVLLSVGLVLLFSARRRDPWTPLASLTGAALLGAGRLAFDSAWLTALGAALLVASGIANAVLCRKSAGVCRGRAPTAHSA